MKGWCKDNNNCCEGKDRVWLWKYYKYCRVIRYKLGEF